MTKRQRGLVLLGIAASFVFGSGVCNRVSSNQVERQIADKRESVRAALAAYDPLQPTGYDPEGALVRRYGLYSLSGGDDQGTVVARSEARWALEYRCVVGQRLPTGDIVTRVVSDACSEVDPRRAFD